MAQAKVQGLAARAAALAINTGVIKDKAQIARIGQLNTRAYQAVLAVRAAYLAANASGYAAALSQARAAIGPGAKRIDPAFGGNARAGEDHDIARSVHAGHEARGAREEQWQASGLSAAKDAWGRRSPAGCDFSPQQVTRTIALRRKVTGVVRIVGQLVRHPLGY